MKKILNAIFRWTMVLGSFMLSSHCFSQLKSDRFEDLSELQNVKEKNVLVFIYTDWCSYCEMMKQSAFKNDEINKIVNNNYYFVSLNAEGIEPIQYAEQTFKLKPSGYKTGTHELATALGTINGQLTYPTVVVLNPKNEIIFQYAGLLLADDLKAILVE